MTKQLCGNCTYWNFKLGGLPDGKEWGECTSPAYHESVRISDRLADYAMVAEIKDTDHYMRVSRHVKKSIRIQHEETSFGCIHWEVTK